MPIWDAAKAGDLAEVERLVGQDPGLLDAKDGFFGGAPLMLAAREGHVGVVRWLLDKGAAIDHIDNIGSTALWRTCCEGRLPVVRLLLERGADPTIADHGGSTPLMTASYQGHVEVVRSLLGHPSAKTMLNRRDRYGKTALWEACYYGRGGVVRVLLESGADPTIAFTGITPMAIARLTPSSRFISAQGRREAVAVLEVRPCLSLSTG
jgi:ankyrin repeat protein